MAIKPDTEGVFYKMYKDIWLRISAVVSGEQAIKQQAETLLPRLTGQSDPEYKAYLNRGYFFNAFARTSDGLTGAVMRKEPVFKLDSSLKDIVDNVTLANESVQEVSRLLVQNLIEYGYYGILVDMPLDAEVDSKPYFSLYAPTAILNHRHTKMGSEYKLTFLTLMETVDEPDPDDEFSTIQKLQVRALFLEDESEKLLVRTYRKTESSAKDEWEQFGEDIIPTIRGQRLDYIPFVFFGAVTNSPNPSDPPLGDLANANIKHWQVSVDYFHGLHYCAIPTPWAAGFGDSSTELSVGGERAWMSSDPQAKCGYLEFTGAGLAAIEKALSRLESQMAVLGARMLEEQKRAAETAETLKIRYSGDSATLSSIVTNVEQGLEKALKLAAKWLGRDDIKVQVTMNKEFVSTKLTPEELTALVGARQQNSISLETFLYNLQTGGILSPDDTIEAEKARIEEEEKKAEEERKNSLALFKENEDEEETPEE